MKCVSDAPRICFLRDNPKEPKPLLLQSLFVYECSTHICFMLITEYLLGPTFRLVWFDLWCPKFKLIMPIFAPESPHKRKNYTHALSNCRIECQFEDMNGFV